MRAATDNLCPSCEEAPLSDGEVLFCPACWALFTPEGRLLTRHQGGCYNFTSDGWFSYLGKEEHVGDELPPFESYSSRITPTLDKLWGHLIWTSLWGALAATSWFLGWIIACWITLVAAAIHLALFGSYWSAVMMQGLLLPAYRPPEWERLSQLWQSGSLLDAQAEMKRLGLKGHPGFQFNQWRALLRAGRREEAEELRSVLEKSLGDHPIGKILQQKSDLLGASL